MACSVSNNEDCFKCDFCRKRFANVVKLIPDCGSSICGECHDGLRDSMDDRRQFKCQACNEIHTMPDAGLPEIKSMMKAVSQMRADEKPLSEKAQASIELLENVQAKMNRLEAFDPKETVNNYCDQLRTQVDEMVDSINKHINQLSDEYSKEIEDYRQGLILNQQTSTAATLVQEEANDSADSSRDNPMKRELAEISRKINQFRTLIHALETGTAIQNVQIEIEEINKALDKLEEKTRNDLFKGKFLQFIENQSLLKLRKLLGEFIYLNSADAIAQKKGLMRTLSGHTEAISKVLFLEKGNLVTASTDSKIKLWNFLTGEIISEFAGHTGPVLSLDVLPNGWLASSSTDKTVRIWDLESNKQIKNLASYTQMDVFSLLALPNGHLAGCSYDDTIKIWNPYISDSNLLLTIKGHGVKSFPIDLVLVPNDTLATCSSEADKEAIVKVWNFKTGKLVNTIPTGFYKARSLVSLGGSQIAIGFLDGSIQILYCLIKSSNITAITTQLKGESVWSLAYQPNSSNMFYSAGHCFDFSIKCWAISTYACNDLVKTIPTDHTDGITSLSISKDGKFIASGSKDTTVKIWSLNGN